MKNCKINQLLQRVSRTDGIMQGLLTKSEDRQGSNRYEVLLEDGERIFLNHSELRILN